MWKGLCISKGIIYLFLSFYLFIYFIHQFLCMYIFADSSIISFFTQFVKNFADFLINFSCINLCRIWQNSWWLFVVSNLWTNLLTFFCNCLLHQFMNNFADFQNNRLLYQFVYNFAEFLMIVSCMKLWIILQTFKIIVCYINLCKLSCRIFKKKIFFVVSICEHFCKILHHFFLHQYLCASLHNFCSNGLETIQRKCVIILSCTLAMQVQQWVSAGPT